MTTANLAITDNETVIQYTSVGELIFIYDFPILSEDELSVSIDQVDQLLGTHYTVQGVGDAGGGTITFLSATTAGELITIWQDMPMERLTGFATGAATLMGADLNTEFARQVRHDQQLRREIGAALRLAPDDPQGGQDMLIPTQTTRAGKVLAFDASGAPTTLTLVSNEDASLRADLASTAVSKGWLLVAVTKNDAEINAGLTIVNAHYLAGNVLRYGAVGDGVANDTVALQAALKIAHLYPMYLPQTDAFYKITAKLELPAEAGVKIWGDGAASIIRQATAGASGIVNNNGTRHGSYLFKDFLIGVDGAISGGVAFDLENITDSHFSNVAVWADDATQGFRTGWRFYSSVGGGALRNYNEDCDVRTDVNAAAVGVLYAGDSGFSSNSNRWIGGQIRADSGTGVSIPYNGPDSTGVSNQNVIETTFEGSTAVGVSIEGVPGAGSIQNNVVRFSRFEGVTTAIAMGEGSRDNVSFANFYSSGVTPYSKHADSKNKYLDVSAHASVDSIMELERGHYRVNNLQDPTVAGFDGIADSAANPLFGAQVTGDTNMRLEVRADGQLEWSPGDAVPDVGIRHQTGRLEVILGKFDANNFLVIDGGLTGPTVTTGAGSPENVVTAPPGSMYTDTGGGAGTTLYIKESGSGDTGWIAK